ncbi:MAG: hypothetical protein IPJ88_13780 [Myxococcales bacterium]|nr:MAG: hypothetical protein IPJ88_13780 [Myxococcales bacterium]
MKTLSIGLVGLLLTLLAACDKGSGAEVEKLADIQPNLPQVPTLPPPPFPVQYSDQSYSVYGLRKKLRNVIDTDVEVTGYIVNIYEPDPCPKGETCPPPRAPHIWLADKADEQDKEQWIRVGGYAENHEEIEKAIRGPKQKIDPESGMIPIPTDFAVGAKIKVKANFTHVSGTGFNDAAGLLDYRGHETLSGGRTG